MIFNKVIKKLFTTRWDLMEKVEARVKQVLYYNSNLDLKDFDVEESFISLGIDKLEQTRLIVEVERHFGFRLNDNEFLNLESTEDLVFAIYKHLSRDFMLDLKTKDDITLT